MPMRDRDAGLAVSAAWLWLAYALCCAVLLWITRDSLPTLTFRDPDDAMRLQQVRDWIGGQGFYDVSQHRVSPPHGGPMHWSRIVDMPVAAMILLLTPLLGAELADIVACAVIPLLTLGGLSCAVLVAARRLAGEKLGLLAAVLLLATPTILVQLTPLRIDHHGWQILLATVALCGAVDPRPWRGGITAGLAIAVWLEISSEALPYAALFGGIFMLRQWHSRDQVSRLVAYAVTLGGGALVLLAVLRQPVALVQHYCDALSSAYIWPLAAFAVATPLAFRFMKHDKARNRFLAAVICGIPAVATFLFTGGECLTGDPFQALGPIAYKLWYLKVMEGRPIWEQDPLMMGLIVLPPIVGLTASLLAARAAPDAQKRDDWLVAFALLAGATAVALMVMRAMSLAHVFALPGIAWLMHHLFQRAQRQRRMIVRVFGSSAVALLAPASLCAIWVGVVGMNDNKKEDAAKLGSECRTAVGMAALRSLPAANLFAPLDIAPDILVRTRHSVTGTAHHRNAAGITAVVEGFTAPPEKARAIMTGLNGGAGPDYLVTCFGLDEFQNYAEKHRGSLAAELERGKTPDWLKPVRVTGSEGLRVYRVMLDRTPAPRH